MQKDRFGYYNLLVKPSFNEALDAAEKPLRIPIPDRAAKRESQSLLRAHLMELSQLWAAEQIRTHDYQMSDDTMPTSALRIGPSDAGADPVFENMQNHAQQAQENAHAEMLRHQYEIDASARLQGERRGALRDIYAQGGEHPVIQNETSATVQSFRMDSDDDGQSSGHASPRDTQRPVRHGVALQQSIAAGRPPPPQFRPFRELNYGERAPTAAAAAVQPGEDESYETMRRNSVVRRYLSGQ